MARRGKMFRVEEVFRAVDRDGDGSVALDEFLAYLPYFDIPRVPTAF